MSAPARKTVELFYDVVSPYSWIGFEVLNRYQQKWNIDVKLKPFFLGGVMQGSGNQPPGMVAAKALYGRKDLHYLRNHFKIPINEPSDFVHVVFEKGSLPTQRFITAIDMETPEHTEELSRQFWLRIWSRDEDITQPEGLAEASKKTGLSSKQIEDALGRIKSPEVKERLKAYTQEALDLGAFGSPIFVIPSESGERQMVFGSDRFHIIADLLGEQYLGPLVDLSKV